MKRKTTTAQINEALTNDLLIIKNLTKEERQAVSSYLLIFQMYCEKDVVKRLQRLQKKLEDKNMIFKFNGDKYAVFSMDQFKRTQFTDYMLSLEDVEEFANKA